MNKFNRAILKKDMTEIQEIPLDAEPLPDIAEPVTDVSEAVVVEPKRRGRPAGAKNKAKPAPAPAAPAQRAPRAAAPPAAKPKARRRVVVPSSDESSEEDQPAPRASRAAPELDRRALAADVLGLLQEQRMSRTMAKRNHYAAWFQNM